MWQSEDKLCDFMARYLSRYEKKTHSCGQGRERQGGTGLGLAGGRRWSLTQGLHTYAVNSQEGRPGVATLLTGCFSPSHCLEMFKGKWGSGGFEVK